MPRIALVSPILPLLAALAIGHWRPAPAQVKITSEAEKIRVEIDGKPFTDFYFQDDAAQKPYLHPLRSASGKLVTRQFPMAKVEGEPTDHPHQRGVWYAHAAVNHVDFWNSEKVYPETAGRNPQPHPRGRITLAKPASVKSGKQTGSITATFDWTTRAGEKLLTEDRVMTFHSHPTLRITDFEFKLTAARKVTFQDEKDGVFGIRVAVGLQEQKSNGKMVNAEGLETEKAAWGKPSAWIDYAGEVEGEKLGIAIFDHPKNFRHPTRWHSRGYGLVSANPFGLSTFTGDKTQNGDVTLEEGKSLTFKYRVVIHPGDVKSANIADLYKEWTK